MFLFVSYRCEPEKLGLRQKQRNNLFGAFNSDLIKFSMVSNTSAPHFTLKLCDSITALVPCIVHLLGHLAGNWIRVSTGCNTK